MAGAARQKIDPQTRQLFDPEVDHPEHDQILTTLFQSDDRLKGMLRSMHGLKDLVQPGPQHRFQLLAARSSSNYLDTKDRVVSFDEAVQLVGGEPPTWQTPDPVRGLQKVLEAPLHFHTERTSRILGFIDLLVKYWIPKNLRVVEASSGKYEWDIEKQYRYVYVEVKSRWPTAGNLMRQLNLYSQCSAGANGDGFRVVVGPDSSMNELLHAHGWRLATFNPELTQFQFCPKPVAPKAEVKVAPNSF